MTWPEAIASIIGSLVFLLLIFFVFGGGDWVIDVIKAIKDKPKGR